MAILTLMILPLAIGFLLDKLLGDPAYLPHPIVGFGKMISFGEKRLNKGRHRMAKGAFLTVGLIMFVYIVSLSFLIVLYQRNHYLAMVLSVILVFFCLAGTTLAQEVRQVFEATDRSLEEGRIQVARIVGRDTSQLNEQQIRTAALETLAENLSDGVIAPLFWFLVLGLPGMLAYKMINTLDSMIGYKNERYKEFGCFAARIDDIANYIPARLTALLMLAVSNKFSKYSFLRQYGTQHASPNSGYPEAALAGILDCRFGGPNVYFGQLIDKPYIGHNNRALNTTDMQKAIQVNQRVEWLMVLVMILIYIMGFL
ncbi:adenosylcobinamide-phosphate synthase CbiB [Neisseria sp. Ec49-e6-T10]|uniref:adenosylcobinamide-phosphate synthase CbiB n=1 Tax=Neisseria sp. Ec49-e6-T10 TaxID=3140744 RepID=UPI003EBF9D95